MQHLRIVGVNDEENVPQLILSDESGREFALPLDEALRHAVTRPPVRSPQAAEASDGKRPLTPREIQARLRAGATVDQVVASSGLTAAHVERYAGPVHAERAYIAQRARATQVAPASAAEAHRLAFGDEPANLEAMVKVRLQAMDVDLASLSWDSWRREDGLWQVSCVFDVDSSATHGAGIGLRPPAEWTFQPETNHLRAMNRWAESLSALSAPVPASRRTDAEPHHSAARRLSAVDSVFDVEDSAEPRGAGSASAAPKAGLGRRASEPNTRGGRTATPTVNAPAPGASASGTDSAGAPASGAAQRGGPPSRSEAGPRREGHEHEDLLDVLRARRGQRLGADAEADDRLALMLNRQDPPEGDAPAASGERSAAPAGADEDEHSTVPIPRLRPVKDAPFSEEAAETEHADSADSEGRGSSGTQRSGRPPHETDRATDDRTAEADGSEGPETDAAGTGAASSGAASADASARDGRLDAWGFAYEGESEERGAAGRPTDPTPAPPAQDEEPAEPAASTEKPRKRAPARRASMPKWDDILFGSKND